MVERDCNDEIVAFEEMFCYRFTEEDADFMELKSKNLPQPAVIYPWKTKPKQWNKEWDYSMGRNQDGRATSRHDSYRNWHRSNDSHRYHADDGECSSYRHKSHGSGHSPKYSQDRNNRSRDKNYPRDREAHNEERNQSYRDRN